MPASGFGETLREARQRRGLTVQQLSDETTIPVPHLEALEAGAIEALPRAMYRRAEVRAYAEAVGIDPDVALTQLRFAEQRQATSTGIVAAPVGTTVSASEALAVGPVASIAPIAAEQVAVVSPPTAAVPSPVNGQRVGRALFILALGCAGLLWERGGAPPLDLTTESASVVPALTPTEMLEEAVRIAEPPRPAPNLRRALYDPRIAAQSQRSSRNGRLDEGMLVVHSTPRGARVTVNGVGWGVTPVAIRYLPMGPLKVRVGKDNYGMHERVVELTTAQPSSTLRVSLTPLRVRMEPTTAFSARDMLVITTVPEGARVTVNGIGWGTTPLAIRHLPAGEQRVRIVKDQFRSEERVVTVGEGRSGRLALTLKPQS